MGPSTVVALVVVNVCCALVSGSRILLLPFPFTSVVNELAYIGDELASRGHDIHILLPSSYPVMERFLQNHPNIKVITYRTKHPDFFSDMQSDPTLIFERVREKPDIYDLRVGTESLLATCRNVLEDADMERDVKALSISLVLVSAFSCSRCYLVFPYRLDIPYVSITTELEPWLSRNPSLPSFVPVQLQLPPLTPKMDFWQRLQNSWNAVAWVLYTDQVPMASGDLVSKYAPSKPAVSMNHLAGQSLLWLMDNDVVLDYPRPMMPNEVYIGGLSVHPAKPLSDELERFAASAKLGLILVAFGSMPMIPEDEMLRILDGLKSVSPEYHIVLRWHLPQMTDVPPNILMLSHVPQNDLLAHPNTKLFVTHAGANGQFEALYHGVPMVSIPIIYDQMHNAKRAEYHGFSKTVTIQHFQPEDLVIAVEEVLGDQNYKERIMLASAIFRAQPMMPRERAAFWVEHVIQHGGHHLHSEALDMPGYQYLMLDVLLFCVLTALVGMWVVYLVQNELVRLFRYFSQTSAT